MGDLVVEVDVAAHRIVVNPPEGLVELTVRPSERLRLELAAYLL